MISRIGNETKLDHLEEYPEDNPCSQRTHKLLREMKSLVLPFACRVTEAKGLMTLLVIESDIGSRPELM